jgi:hypothetical protein
VEQAKRVKRVFTPEQKANILHQIGTDLKSGMTVNQALEKQDIVHSV